MREITKEHGAYCSFHGPSILTTGIIYERFVCTLT